MIFKGKETEAEGKQSLDATTTAVSPPRYSTTTSTIAPSEPETSAPSYERTANSRISISDAPPDYALQSNFKIGKATTPKPLVAAAQLQLHLDLLRAFKELRTRVERDQNGFLDIVQALEPERRWVWFLELAVARYASHVL